MVWTDHYKNACIPFLVYVKIHKQAAYGGGGGGVGEATFIEKGVFKTIGFLIS